MHYTIYKTTNTINGKIYIGYHKATNIDDDYMGSGKIIKRAFAKYSKENFTKEILHLFDNHQEMVDKESELVDESFVNREDTYNVRTGGAGNPMTYRSAEHRKRISESMKGRPSLLKGRKLTKEHKTKLSLSRIGKVFSIEHCDNISKGNRGRMFTEEHRQNLSQALLGNTPWNKGILRTNKEKEKMSRAAKNRKPIQCEYCGMCCQPSLHVRWHGENCKKKATTI